MLKISFIFATVLALSVVVIANNEKLQPMIEIYNKLHMEPGPLTARQGDVQTLWIEQKLDNFDKSETRTWKMRYMTNDEFYKPGGPLFIFVGGEWYISPTTITSGHIYDMAKEHNGYLFYTEHRFYGESRPVESMTNDNMKYLNVQQALEDLAHFIRTMKATIDGMENSKVILIGGSYSGTMVTWFKKLYPDLATGCWASSAPLKAKSDFYEYKEVMGQSIKLLGSESCFNRFDNGFTELELMFSDKRGGEVKAMLQLCNSFDETNDLDMFTLFYEISELFASLVQTHNDGDIQKACTKMMQASTDLIGLVNYIVDKFDTKGCIDFSYRSYLKLFTNTEFGSNIMRPWTYQTCNEFGWFQTSKSRAQPFGTKYPLDFFTTLCGDAYGEQFSNEYITNRVLETNSVFGGLKPRVENVYWTHGDLDPWSAVGMKNTQATIIPGYAHCKDFDSISSKDSKELKASKERIAELVRKWLKE